ncbi:glycosidase [Novosphingobium lentum]|uniref:glycosidase n=1 Tax=Novosphingobium lentum TaxID=145287 RepID=UPI00082BDD89|nr:glycosidase [Novosphingobium lentum]
MVDYVVQALDQVTLDISGPDGLLAGHDLMSPYVWTQDGRHQLLVRVLAHPLAETDPTGIIYCGHSDDGLSFIMRDRPAIVPGPDFVDAGGVEDPTVVLADQGEVLVFYTGVDGQRGQGSMMVARGCDLEKLAKEQVLLKAPPGEGNIKEATVAQGTDGRFRLFYEYAKEITPGVGASRIGMAIAPGPNGPWEVVDDPFGIREDAWDNWHLSTGPIVSQPGADPVMFYNGATVDARWRIGWISFDANFERITDRCIQPMLIPPPPVHRDGTDIAFAASCLVEDEAILLYYSLEDRLLRRAAIRRFD